MAQEDKETRTLGWIGAGRMGYAMAERLAKAGNDISVWNRTRSKAEPLTGYQEVKPMVFAGIFPKEGNEYQELREAIEKLKLNDAALMYEGEQSQALGFGFRCGFLGILHLEIFQEIEHRAEPLVYIQSFWSKAGEGLGNGWGMLQNLVLGLLNVWPLALLVSLIWWRRKWVFGRFRRKRVA